jgi:hypothetical protein
MRLLNRLIVFGNSKGVQSNSVLFSNVFPLGTVFTLGKSKCNQASRIALACCESPVCSLVSVGEVRLSPLGTSATVWPVAPAPDDDECGAVGGTSDRGN